MDARMMAERVARLAYQQRMVVRAGADIGPGPPRPWLGS
jgi:hypothetical protein